MCDQLSVSLMINQFNSYSYGLTNFISETTHFFEYSYKQSRDLCFFDIYNILLLDIWRPSSLNELTPMIFNTGLTHLRSEASIYQLWVFLEHSSLEILLNQNLCVTTYFFDVLVLWIHKKATVSKKSIVLRSYLNK